MLIPKGTYKARGIPVMTDTGETYAQIGLSSNENHQVAICFQLAEGEDAGRTITWYGSLSDKAWERTVEALRYCGFQGDELATLPSQKLDNEVQIVIEHEEYKGKMGHKVRWVNRLGGGIRLEKPVVGNELKHLSALMKSKIASVPQVSAPAPKQGPGQGAPRVGKDGIPF